MSWPLRIFAMTTVLIGSMAAFGWATDKIAWQGEITVYTARCDGPWNGKRCEGTLQAGERYRFRALRAHREVLFWIVGSSEPSAKFVDCDIADRRNWTCKPTTEAGKTIALKMERGQPLGEANPAPRALHSLPKWQWWLLGIGIPVTHEANE